MAKNLLIVESPAKAKTIEKYLGKDFKVQSSYGHIRDLEKGDKGVNIEKNYEPKYAVSPEKRKVVKQLKDWTKKVENVWLATDEDREGEAISWHLCKVLGLDEHTTKRIVFREITKSAIEKAIQSPRTVDLNLVNAQQARRILDRLVGFELSSVLWRKVKNKLSAGRVQSVAVKLIVEKEREIQNFQVEAFFRVSAVLQGIDFRTKKPIEFKAELAKRFSTIEDARKYLEDCAKATFTVSDVEVKPTKRRPAPPFTTSTLQQDASRKLGFAVKRTMSVAQKLYEKGFISYMRTDSVSLSKTARDGILAEIEDQFGVKYQEPRFFKSKSANAQEAHEAIRPTYFNRFNVSGDRDEQRLYEIIWKRAVASQMADAIIEKTKVTIDVSTRPSEPLVAKGEVIKFDGFLKLYVASTDEKEQEKNELPALNSGQNLNSKQVEAKERFTRPPARYTEAGLVKKLEELGIGRPSTYAPTITKIMEESRGYVVKENRDGVLRTFKVLNLEKGEITETLEEEVTGAIKNRLIATDLGMVVSDFLDEHFEEIMNYNFTADIEKKFDRIAEGDGDWQKVIDSFYKPFHSDIEETLEKAERATGERVLGKDPESGRTLIVRMTKFGRPVAQIGTPDELADDEKPKYGNLKIGQSLETISYEEAMDLFKLPRDLGTYKGESVQVLSGRFGPYIKFGDKNVTMPRTEDPVEISADRVHELIEEKIKEDMPIGMHDGHPMTKGKGRFGPFIKWNGLFANVPKRIDFENITVSEALELVKAKIEKEANRYILRWPDENIAVENGRWGPFIRFKKKSVKLPKKGKEKYTSEQAAELTLEQVKKFIEDELPGSFKKKVTKKKTAAKKKVVSKKKTPAKKKS